MITLKNFMRNSIETLWKILTNEFSEPTISYKNTNREILLRKNQISWKNHNGMIKVKHAISLDMKDLQKKKSERGF